MTRVAPEDIRDFLLGFAAAIELDQVRVDAMPREKFHPLYSDAMWRMWRNNHLEYINRILLPTLNGVPAALLKELTRVAMTYEPAAVGRILIHTFSDAASGCCAEEVFETTSLFLGCFFEEIGIDPPEKSINSDARARMMQWLPVTDPLNISKDPECGYGQPAGFVN